MRLGILGAMLVAGLVAAPAVALSPEKAEAAARLVVKPRSDQRVRSHPVRVVVRADDGLRDLRAHLNGRRVDKAFGVKRRGKRRASLGASHGVRHGRNLLRVRARRPNGSWRKARARFRVVHRRPLAGAGRDQRVSVGRRVKLSGRASKPWRRGRSPRRRALRHRWRLARAPKGSRLRGAPGKPTPWSPKHRKVARFTPDAPGTYRFELNVRQGGRSSTDTVDVEAPAGWLVPINTMAGDHEHPGIKVGEKKYSQDSGGAAFCVAQVLVLERATLGFVSNTTYGLPGVDVCQRRHDLLHDDLSRLKGDKLVIVVSHPRDQVPTGLGRSLAPIGMPQGDNSVLGAIHTVNGEPDPAGGGQISVIGVPGMPRGEADVRVVYDDTGRPGDGRMVGYLTPDQYGNFGWLSHVRADFDTRAQSTGDATGPANTIQVGDRRYSRTLPGGARGGFQVVVLDRYTLAERENKVFAVAANRSAQQNAQSIKDMAALLADWNKVRLFDLVLISSLGTPAAQLDSWDIAPALSDLGDRIRDVGGTRHAFNSSLLHGRPYSLLGWSSAGETAGEEAGPAIAADQRDARLRGALVPNNITVFRPQNASPYTRANDALLDKLVEAPTTKWPLDDDPGAKKALSYLGSLDERLGPNPRTAYVNDNDWDRLIGEVQDAKYPGSDHGFTEDDFAKAQRQLVQELRWVANVRQYVLENLSSPFSSEAEFSDWAKLQDIARTIQNAANAKPDDNVASIVLDVAGAALQVATVAIPEEKMAARVITELVSVVYETGLEYWTQNRDGGSDDEITTKAAQLGVEFTDHFNDAKKSFETMANIIVTDPAKLAFVGTHGGCNPDNSGCPTEWAWDDAAKQTSAAAMYRGAESSFYTALFPLGFPSYRLYPRAVESEAPPDEEFADGIDLSGPPSIDKYGCSTIGMNRPFKGLDQRGYFAYTDYRYLPSRSPRAIRDQLGLYLFFALGGKKIDRFHPSPPKPPSGNPGLARMFDPLDTGNDPTKGGLGMDKLEFMLNAQPRNYGPKDPFGSDCKWTR